MPSNVQTAASANLRPNDFPQADFPQAEFPDARLDEMDKPFTSVCFLAYKEQF